LLIEIVGFVHISRTSATKYDLRVRAISYP